MITIMTLMQYVAFHRTIDALTGCLSALIVHRRVYCRPSEFACFQTQQKVHHHQLRGKKPVGAVPPSSERVLPGDIHPSVHRGHQHYRRNPYNPRAAHGCPHSKRPISIGGVTRQLTAGTIDLNPCIFLCDFIADR